MTVFCGETSSHIEIRMRVHCKSVGLQVIACAVTDVRLDLLRLFANSVKNAGEHRRRWVGFYPRSGQVWLPDHIIVTLPPKGVATNF